ncbi:hypothetical protein E2C01_046586 [Portunus trituberculatus]|uniref:Secreted protein n=1 Tax=Portunus trituberculatus TaxID=210409 RepID=A0A5B7FY98_PORTR|nr:hypothetical protein [Portunus trituberculatus]
MLLVFLSVSMARGGSRGYIGEEFPVSMHINVTPVVAKRCAKLTYFYIAPRFYTASEINVGIKIVKTLTINHMTSLDPF